MKGGVSRSMGAIKPAGRCLIDSVFGHPCGVRVGCVALGWRWAANCDITYLGEGVSVSATRVCWCWKFFRRRVQRDGTAGRNGAGKRR